MFRSSTTLLLLALLALMPVAWDPSSATAQAQAQAQPQAQAPGAPAASPALQLLRTLLEAKESQARDAAFEALSKHGDATLVPALQAYYDGLLEDRSGQLVIYQPRVEVEGQKKHPVVDAITLKHVLGADQKPLFADALGKAMLKAGRADRRRLDEIMAALSLLDPDPHRRKAAIIAAADKADAGVLPALKAQLASPGGQPYARVLQESIARIDLATGERDAKIAAAKMLAELGSLRSDVQLKEQLDAATKAGDKDLAAAAKAGLDAIAAKQTRLNMIQNTFAGLSLGSILVLLALGLSIIFGVMGVINMAHGEFMMIGAFTTFVVSELFKRHLPGVFDWYFVAAIPAAFLVAGFFGLLCETLIIRHLYGRPLETLLATWGVSLLLIQMVRRQFGDTNALTPPTWLSGGWEVLPDLFLPLNRLFIIGFCVVCVAMMYLIVEKTKLGLLLRATSQNRTMSAALGVPTRWVDALTFALGAGLAGLAGVAVPLFDKINPQMGQGYIVDSFMVVVLGGVGKLAGAIVAGLGLGFMTKYIEPVIGGTGAVIYGKIIVLVMIILVLQKRPSGLFPAKGRLAEA